MYIVVVCTAACGRYGFHSLPDGAGSDAVADASAGSDSAMAVPISCIGLAPTCGPAHDGTCCDSLRVPGGTFLRSYDVGQDAIYTDNSNPATVAAFYLDRYEVTVGRFKAFVAAGVPAPANGAGAHSLIANSGWDSTWNTNLDASTIVTGLTSCSTSNYSGADNLPLNCVTWYEAFAFCIWDGGYLPTEAEWNYAATGGNEQRAYPWSSPPSSIAIDCSQASYDTCGTMTPVGQTSPQGDGRWGHADLAGNVWEKTLDWYVGSDNGGYASASCDNCANLVTQSTRAVRGGGWNGALSVARPAYRYYDPPTDRYVEMGMRCAKPAP